MSSRNPGYVIGVILLAIVFSLPQIVIASIVGIQLARNPTPSGFKNVILNSMLRIPGFGETTYVTSSLLSASFSHGKFIDPCPYYGETQLLLGYQEIDPETGDVNLLKTGTSLGNTGQWPLESFVLGDQIWFRNGVQVFDVVDGKLNPSMFTPPPKWTAPESFFRRNGELSFVADELNGFIVSTLKPSGWQVAGMIVPPESPRPNGPGGFSTKSANKLDIQIRNVGDSVHVFLNLDGRLFYREGIELSPVPGANAKQLGQTEPAAGETASAMAVVASDGKLKGWSLVHEQSKEFEMLNGAMKPPTYLSLFVNGEPCALAFEAVSPAERVVHGFRLDGTTWTEFASQALPFGSTQWRTVSSTDGQRSYLVVSTSNGSAHVYSVDSTGFRETDASDKLKNPVLRGLVSTFIRRYGLLPIAGILLGIFVWHLMWWFTKPDYGFGLQTVRLASLGWRGFARLIDLGLIALPSLGLGWLATLGLDWSTLFESLNLKVDHPTISIVRQAATLMAVWVVMSSIGLIAVQAILGVTPGKWLCRLKTVRTSLRPCGFKASLTREIIFFVDCCNFLCWTPGILSIAFTDRRQRLGDRVADTIVIESRSLVAIRS